MTGVTSRIRVFVADDHAVVREGLARILQRVADVDLVGSADTARQVLRLAPGADWDVLVLDLSLPDGGGAEVLSQLQSLRPDIKVVVYSMYPEAQYGARLLRAGASAYLSKRRSTEELLEAIRRAAHGRRYVTEAVADNLVALDPTATSAHDGLTQRELQVLVLLAEGAQTTAIAKALNIAKSTVSTHISRIKTKLSAETVTDLVRYAFRAGLVE